MGVDIKSLRVGSHVEFEGKLHKAMEIRSDGSVTIGRYTNFHGDCMPPEGAKVKGGIYKGGYIVKNYSCSDIQPIEITPALLEELGFKFRKSAGGSWCISDKKGGYFYATVCSDNTCIVTHYPDFGFQSRVVCTYLHELEAFAYLIAKTELIQD